MATLRAVFIAPPRTETPADPVKEEVSALSFSQSELEDVVQWDDHPRRKSAETDEPSPGPHPLRRTFSLRKLAALNGEPANGDGPLPYQPSLFDPCGLRRQETWKSALAIQTKKYFTKEISGHIERYLLLGFFVCAAVALIALDIRRELLVIDEANERQKVLDSFLQYIQEWYSFEIDESVNLDGFDPFKGVPSLDIRPISQLTSSVELGIRILWIVLSFPFTLSCHFTRAMAESIRKALCRSESALTYSEGDDEPEEEETQILLKVLLYIGVTIFVIGLVLLWAGLIFNVLFHPFRLEHLEYVEPTWEPVTNDTEAVMCGNQPLGWRMIDLAGAPLLLDLFPDAIYKSCVTPEQQSVFAYQTYGWDYYFALIDGIDPLIEPAEAFWRYFHRFAHYPVLKTDPEWIDELEPVDGRLFVYNLNVNDNFGIKSIINYPIGSEYNSIYGFTGVSDSEAVGLTLEIIWTYWFKEFMMAIIPYYNLVNSIFLDTFWDSLADNVITLFYGPNRMSWIFSARFQAYGAILAGWDNLWAFLDGVESVTDHFLVFVGHGYSGAFVKGLAPLYRQYGVAFESGQFSRSPISTTFHISEPKGETMLNIFSGTSIMSMAEPLTKVNEKLPDLQSIWKPSNVYETFCLVAAGCVYDDAFDHVCSEAVGMDVYRQYFREWNRTRFDDFRD
jgi:hypothetical protein